MNAPTASMDISWATYRVDPDATIHDLLNDATEMLQYSQNLIVMMRDALHEEEVSDRQCAAIALGAIAALTRMGVECLTLAHEQYAVGCAMRGDGACEPLRRQAGT